MVRARILARVIIACRIVAPSLVMHTSPSGDCSILSIPLGPSEVLRMEVTALAARMLAFWAASPRVRPFFAPSLMITNGRPYSSKASDIALGLRGKEGKRGGKAVPSWSVHARTSVHAAPPPASSLHGCARRLHLVATEAPAIFLRLPSRRWIGVLRVGSTHAEGRAAAFYKN